MNEGCNCNAVGPGSGSYFALAGQISKLVADPTRCRAYALDEDSSPELVVLDTAAKAELTRIELPGAATDVDLSPNGEWLVVAHDTAQQVSIVDLEDYEVAATVAVTSDAYAIEVSDDGVAYYAGGDLRRIDLKIGIVSDEHLATSSLYSPDIELSSDGTYLFAGESGISGGDLYKWDLSSGDPVLLSQSIWEDGYGFSYPLRRVLVSPGGEHAYYAESQLLGDNLALVTGNTAQVVFTEDLAGTFAVGAKTVFDAVTLRKLADLPQTAVAAALVSEDTELWYYENTNGRVHYANVSDFIGSAVLGQRELTPEPLANYVISRLIADPGRPRLYAIDSTHNLALAIDSNTLDVIAAIAVGTVPSDLAVNLTGDTLFVGHKSTLGLARIDLEDLTFDGWVPVPRVPYEVEALSGGHLAIVDDDQWTNTTLIDETGDVYGSNFLVNYYGTLAATPDGNTLFVGSTSLGYSIIRFDVSGSEHVKVDETSADLTNTTRRAVPLPDGSAVFYAKRLFDGGDLDTVLYSVASPVLTVTPDASLATTSDSAIEVSSGEVLGTLPKTGSVQAMDPDGQTLYVVSGGAIEKVDLTGF